MVDAACGVASESPGVVGGFQDRLIPRFTPPLRSVWPAAPGCSWRWSFPSRTGCEPPRSSAASGRRPPSSPSQILSQSVSWHADFPDTLRVWLDFVHLGSVGEDVGELSVNCVWGFSAVGFQPRQCNISVGQPQHEVRRFRHVSNFCTKSSLVVRPSMAERCFGATWGVTFNLRHSLTKPRVS